MSRTTNEGPEDDQDFLDESEIVDSEMEESFEPVGSCEECGTNLYEDDDVELCDQCLWSSLGGVENDEDEEAT